MNSLMKSMTPAFAHPFLENRDHIMLENADNRKDIAAIDAWINASPHDGHRRKFLLYHITMTTPVFGEWNWVKAERLRNPDWADEYAFVKQQCDKSDAIINSFMERVPRPLPKKWFDCSLCEKTGLEGHGNNPWPYPGAKCCNDCNQQKVISARVLGLKPEVLNKTQCDACQRTCRHHDGKLCKNTDTGDFMLICPGCYDIIHGQSDDNQSDIDDDKCENCDAWLDGNGRITECSQALLLCDKCFEEHPDPLDDYKATLEKQCLCCGMGFINKDNRITTCGGC